MKLNWGERLAVNNPIRPVQQQLEVLWLEKHMSLVPGARILEIGCGRGAGSLIIKKTFSPSVLHAMDLDIRMIKNARTYLFPEERKGVSFYVGDVNHLPYRDESVNAVFGFGVLHHIEDWQAAVSEIARILKPGGVYIFEELYPSLYQNTVTRHFLLHPTENRFYGNNLNNELKMNRLYPEKCLELKKIGILGFAIKK